jgi:hypothetical protein
MGTNVTAIYHVMRFSHKSGAPCVIASTAAIVFGETLWSGLAPLNLEKSPRADKLAEGQICRMSFAEARRYPRR